MEVKVDGASVTTVDWIGIKLFDFVFCCFLFLRCCSFPFFSFKFFVLGLVSFFYFSSAFLFFFHFFSSSIARHSTLVNTLAEPVIVGLDCRRVNGSRCLFSTEIEASGTDNVLGLNGIIPACLKQPEQMFSGVVVLSQAFENNIEKLMFVIAFPGDD